MISLQIRVINLIETLRKERDSMLQGSAMGRGRGKKKYLQS
jgi:hypothetical protein